MSELTHFFSTPPETKERRKTYSGLFKAQVVSEFINKKKPLKELAEYYDIHPNQIKNWKSQLMKGACYILDDKRCSRPHGGKHTEQCPALEHDHSYGKFPQIG